MSTRHIKCYGCFISALEEHKHVAHSLITAHIHYRCPLLSGNKSTAGSCSGWESEPCLHGGYVPISLRTLYWPLGSRRSGGLLEGKAWRRKRQKKEWSEREKGENRREEAPKITTTESQKGSGDQDAGERAQNGRQRRQQKMNILERLLQITAAQPRSHLPPPSLLIFLCQSAI